MKTKMEGASDLTGDILNVLIASVESRPALYDLNSPDFSNKHLKEELWCEVCECIFSNWSDLPLAEQFAKSRHIQDRWQNLKSCFRREITKQKKETPGSAKRKRYVYYDKLSFLLPYVKDSIYNREPKQEPVPIGVREIQYQIIEPRQQTSAVNDIDEDKSFLMSLVPTFRSLSKTQKFDAKIKILTVLKDVQNGK